MSKEPSLWCASARSILFVLCTGAMLQAQMFREDDRSALPLDCGEIKAIYTGDLDNDGNVDLVFGNGTLFTSYHTAMITLRGDGHGRWRTAWQANFPPTYYALGTADLDVDGDLDVVFDAGTGRNDGSGTLTLQPYQFEGANGGIAAIADFTGDGLADVVTRGRFHRNLGGLQFADETALRAPGLLNGPQSMVVLDADGDGDRDLCLGYSGQDQLLLNQNGVFQLAAAALPVDAGNTWAMAAADLDGDADLDLVFGDVGSAPRLYRNQGNGTFVDASAALALPSLDVWSVALGDVDGDNDVDIVFGESDGGRLLRNQAGTFVAAPTQFDARQRITTALTLADLDGDGDLDLVQGCSEAGSWPGMWITAMFGMEPKVLWNDGTGAFLDVTRSDLPARENDTFAAVGDVDRDGLPDVVLASGSGHLLRNDGNANFTDVPQQFPSGGMPRLADLDADGWLDCVLLAADGRFWTLRNQAGVLVAWQGPFQIAGLPGAPGVSALDAELADFDGDGRFDLLVATGGPGLNWPNPGGSAPDGLWLGQPNGLFVDASMAWLGGVATNTQDFAVGDLDGDNDLDAVAAGRWLENTGTAFVSHTFSAPYGAGIAAVALADVDGDFDLDVVIANKCSGWGCAPHGHEPQNELLHNDGAGNLTHAGPLDNTYNTASWAVAAADFDEDGDLDLLFGNGGGPANDQLVLNLGGGQWNGSTWGTAFPKDLEDTRQLLVADFDRDGDLDVIGINRARNDGAPRTKVYRNLRRQLWAPASARPGHPYELEVHGAQSGAMIWVALQPARTPLPPYGELGLGPLGLGLLSLLPSGSNVATASFVLPNDVTLIGATAYLQAITLAPTLAASRFTNTIAETVIGW